MIGQSDKRGVLGHGRLSRVERAGLLAGNEPLRARFQNHGAAKQVRPPCGVERRGAWQRQSLDQPARIVGLLDAIDQWAAPERRAPDIHADVRMGVKPLGLHLEIERHHIALSPDPVDGRVAIQGLECGRLAIDRCARVLRPAWNAQLEIESRRRLGIDLDADLAYPWIVARLAERDFRACECRCGFKAAVEVEGDAVLARRYRVAGYRRDQARHVILATGSEVPGPYIGLPPA